MLFLTASQQCKSTEGIWVLVKFLEHVHHEVSLIDSAVLRSVAFPKGEGVINGYPRQTLPKLDLTTDAEYVADLVNVNTWL